MILRALCLLLLAAPVLAGGITSFEPDTTSRQARGDREPTVETPMVETPIWYGVTLSVGTPYEQSWNGFANGPSQLGAIATGVTWPWRSRLQGWSEFAYVLRTLLDERTYQPYWSPGLVYVQSFETRLDMFTVRGGVEYRFGAKGRPWCTAGAGIGGGFSFGDDPAAASEALGRLTCFLYPSGHTRLGLMLSGGPAWITSPSGVYFLSGGQSGGVTIRTHYEVALRIESRLRFPVANAD